MENKTKKEELQYIVENWMTEEQCETFTKIFEMFSSNFVNKGDLMRFSFTKEENNKIDSALPCDYVNRIQKIHPNFKTMFHCYNYNNTTFGEMCNVAEAFVMKIVEKFNQ